MRVKDYMPDPKHPERIVDSDVTKRKVLLDGECRGHDGSATEGHHIIFKSQGGDDLLTNVAPLCLYCHDIFHRGIGSDQREVALEIGRRFQPVEIEYVIGKLGLSAGYDFLRRRYHFSECRWIHRSNVPIWPRFWRATWDYQRRYG